MTDDLISRAAASKATNLDKDCNPDHFPGHEKFIQFMDDVEIGGFGNWQFANGFNLALIAAKVAIEKLPSAQPEQRWTPFETRPLTEKEKEEYPEWDCILNCKLPDDGQRILVSIRIRGHEEVQQDEFYSDYGSYPCLDSGYEIGTEAVAWMPLPEPWEET